MTRKDKTHVNKFSGKTIFELVVQVNSLLIRKTVTYVFEPGSDLSNILSIVGKEQLQLQRSGVTGYFFHIFLALYKRWLELESH